MRKVGSYTDNTLNCSTKQSGELALPNILFVLIYLANPFTLHFCAFFFFFSLMQVKLAYRSLKPAPRSIKLYIPRWAYSMVRGSGTCTEELGGPTPDQKGFFSVDPVKSIQVIFQSPGLTLGYNKAPSGFS